VEGVQPIQVSVQTRETWGTREHFFAYSLGMPSDVQGVPELEISQNKLCCGAALATHSQRRGRRDKKKQPLNSFT
jgi:hypothetical protein